MIPSIQLNEPLMTECLHCIDCVRSGEKPLTDGYDGLDEVRALEAATHSMRRNSVCILPDEHV